MILKYYNKTIINKNTIFLLFLLVPVIDVLTGFFALNLGLYSGYNMGQKIITLLPGILIRLILFIKILFELNKYKPYYFYLILILFIILYITEFLAFFNSFNIGTFLYGVIYIYKMIFIYIVLFYLLYVENKELILNMNFVVINVVLWYSMAIILGHIIGVEYYTYGGLGSSGFLIKGSANSASLAFLIASPFILYKLFLTKDKKEKFYLWILYFLLIYASFILLTKVSVLSLLIMLIIFFYYKAKYGNVFEKFFIFIILFILVVIFINYMLETNFINRLLYVYNYFDGNILKMLMSGRDQFIKYGYNIYINDYSCFQQLFGVGANEVRELMSVYAGDKQGIEVDFGDIITKYGLIGFVIFYSIFIYYFFVSIKNILFSKNIKVKLFSFAYIFMFFISNIAGHVFVSGLMGFLVPFLIINLNGGKVKYENTSCI